jgi:hypothetical protein
MAQNHMKKPGVKAALTILLAGGIAIILQLLGVRFIPSDAYLYAINPPAFVSALALAAIVARQLIRLEPASGAHPPGRTRRGALFLIFTGLLFVTGYLTAAVTVPMTAVLISGSNTAQYVIAGKQPAGLQRGCGAPVSLTYPHFIFNTLCGVDGSVRDAVEPGDRLRLDGYGNSAGLYYSSVLLAD